MATVLSAPPAPTPLLPPAGCTFDAADWAILARHWYPVALSREVGDGPLGARLLDQPLVVYRAGGQVVVAPDHCPHRGVPLSMGQASGAGVVCPYHGLTFGAKGACVHVPAHPARDIPARLHLNTYPAVERYGLVWTCLDREADPAAIPAMPHWDEAGFQQITCPWIDIAGFAGRQVEGFLDVAHFAFVHTDTFADPANAQVPTYSPRRAPHGFEAEYWSTVGNYPHSAGKAAPDFAWLRHFRCHVPFTATLEIHFPGADRLVIMNAASPVSARKTRMFAPIARNFDTHLPVQDVYDFNRRVFEEDRALVEAQVPAALPLDPAAEAHLPADMSSMIYRRSLREMGLGRFFAQ
ncbi:MAG TPA: aromatic ring-hydroxylating dioxygenase subunit alpha [Novosphingobium sp.]|nr:aromatic ring-hydroxylating dioxygenase subunit alpha [Novosphingobium sp.]